MLTLNGFGQEADSVRNKKISWRVFPAFGAQPETGFVFGFAAAATLTKIDTARKEFNRPSTLTPFAIYSVRNQFLIAFGIDHFFKGGQNLNISPRFSLFPDRYFGIGNNNDPDSYETFTNQFWQLEGQVSIPYTNKIFWGIYMDVQQSDLQELATGGELEQGVIPGSKGGFQAGFGPAIRFDSRNDVIYPYKGYFINVRSLFSYIGDFSYSNYTFDLRRYISIRDDRDILAVQLNGSFTSGSSIPFYKLPQLGGSNGLRGITNANLYVDRQLLFSQLEYRKYLFWAFCAVAFIGAGDVVNEVGELSFSNMRYVGGAGLRFQILKEQRLNIRFDYGVARGNQSAFYISIREAF